MRVPASSRARRSKDAARETADMYMCETHQRLVGAVLEWHAAIKATDAALAFSKKTLIEVCA
jgi:hypothetical protein